jgi:RNA recognition motif-containing protein
VSRKLFVGGLAWRTDNDGLHAAFAEFGEVVEAKVIYSRDDGRSRGFGFVTYNDAETAQAAAQQANGMQLDGRTLRVDAADEKPPRRNNENRW